MSKYLFLVGAALQLAASALAQQPDTAVAPSTLDDVVVTANKISQKQSQTGKVVTVIDRQTIERSAAKNIGQLLQEQAGVTVNGALNAPGTNQSIYTRGASSGRTLVLIDGVPAYDPSLISNDFDLNLINLQQVQRIEVARGAQSTLYGSDAIGGVINIITTDAGNKQPLQTDAMLSYGSFNTLRANVGVTAQSDKTSLNIRYGKVKSSGFSTATDRQGNRGFDDDGFNSDNWNASMGFKIAERWSARAFGMYTRYRTDLDNGSFADDADYTSRQQNGMVGGSLQYQGPRLLVKVQYTFNQLNRTLIDDSTSIGGFAKYSENIFNGKAHFAEAFANLTLGKGFSLLAGTDFRHSFMNNRFLSISSFGPFADVFPDTTVQQWSAYGSLMYNSTRFNMEAGIRYNRHEQYGDNTTFTVNPSYQIARDWRVFASVASGFKTPSLYQLYSAFGNPDLLPEKSVNYEMGVSYQRKQAQVRVLGFYRDIKDGLDFDNINFVYFNYNRQKVWGAELEGSVKATDWLQFQANYTFLSPDELSQSRITNKDTSYSYLLRRPAHQVNLLAAVTPIEKAFISLSARWVSERFDVGGFRAADVKLDPYWLIGLHASYQVKEALTLFADVQNLANTSFIEIRGYNSMPRNIQAGLRLRL